MLPNDEGCADRLFDCCPPRHSVRPTDSATIGDSDRAVFDGIARDEHAWVAARRVLNAATRRYHEVPRSERAATGLDAASVDRALDGQAATGDVPDGWVREVVRACAQRAAGQTRDQRIAGIVRRSRQLETEMARTTRRYDRRPASYGPILAILGGGLGVAFHGNARVWIARRLAAHRWTWWCSSSCGHADAGSC